MTLHSLNVPAQHNAICMSAGWTAPTPYNDSVIVPQASAGPTTPFVRLSWPVNYDVIPADAGGVLVRIKSKVDISEASGSAYAQTDSRAYKPGMVSNHLVHTEEWGRPAGGSNTVGRRISYTTAVLPIVSGVIYLDVAHGIYGRGNVEVAVYVEGYSAP